jgi:uncharacterized protein (DUF302 family)
MTGSIAFQIHLDQSYEEALEAVAAALKSEGFGILTKIDVRATLKEKLGKDFRPYAILGACNPPLAHRALAHDAQAGLMLPLQHHGRDRPRGRLHRTHRRPCSDAASRWYGPGPGAA